MDVQQSNTSLNISGKKQIRDLQLAFNSVYPFLRIEFYKEQPGLKAGHKKYLEGSSSLTAAGLTNAGNMLISDSMTVSQLENQLKDNFGLKAHAFRKSGTMWLEITMTGNWSLKHQNQHGQELCEPIKTELLKDREEQDNSLE